MGAVEDEDPFDLVKIAQLDLAGAPVCFSTRSSFRPAIVWLRQSALQDAVRSAVEERSTSTEPHTKPAYLTQRMVLRHTLHQRHIAGHPTLQPLVSTHTSQTKRNPCEARSGTFSTNC